MSKRLLIIDDALIIRELIKDAAKAAGWEIVAEAANGQVAIDKFREVRPDAVTLDLVMPEYNGLHALQGIKELDPEARVLVVSALEQTSVLKEALQLGATDFIVKPFDKAHVVAALDAMLTGAMKQRTAGPVA